jgi:membrane dipeptidase
MADGRGPRIDLHSHAGRCFLAGLPAGHSLVATMGAAAVADAVRAARAAGMTALVLAAVADFAVLRPDPATGLRAHRGFHAGEAYADYQRQLAGIREAAAEAGAEVAASAADLDRAARDRRTAVLLGCEGGDFLEGDLRRLEEARAAGLTVLTLVHYRVNEIGDVQTEASAHNGLSRFGRDVVAECNRLGIVVDCAHASLATTMAVLEASSQPVIISHGQLGPDSSGADSSDMGHPRLMTAAHAAAVAGAGGLVGAWPCGITSRSLADFGTEITRLAEAVGPGHVALGTDLDGNYRPVLTSYDQLDDLGILLRDRGLPAAHVHQILGGNALNLLNHVLLPVFTPAKPDCQAVLHGGSVESWGGGASCPRIMSTSTAASTWPGPSR